MSNVRRHSTHFRTLVMSLWPLVDYFHANTATSRARLAELDLIAQEGWYELYRHKTAGSLWRIDREDKYRERFMVEIKDFATWQSFDSTQLEMRLLLDSRGGLSGEHCLVAGCQKHALLKSAFCLEHTYERGVQK